ncbi:hypothetical protein Q5P01_025506 [Channa striata]|uniref:Uncharacterized protein n=1 Tax=Channa striata TaxID=64152 RepID=A0AA88IMI0_CHASR|nr:hypothetical protein Q5P01_025506 [Channa striata]
MWRKVEQCHPVVQGRAAVGGSTEKHLGSCASVPSTSHFYLPVDCDDIDRHDNSSSGGVLTIHPGVPLRPCKSTVTWTLMGQMDGQ